jgi:hypothetical protein
MISLEIFNFKPTRLILTVQLLTCFHFATVCVARQQIMDLHVSRQIVTQIRRTRLCQKEWWEIYRQKFYSPNIRRTYRSSRTIHKITLHTWEDRGAIQYEIKDSTITVTHMIYSLELKVAQLDICCKRLWRRRGYLRHSDFSIVETVSRQLAGWKWVGTSFKRYSDILWTGNRPENNTRHTKCSGERIVITRCIMWNLYTDASCS